MISCQGAIDHANGLEAQVDKLQRFIESRLSRAEIEKANAEMAAA